MFAPVPAGVERFDGSSEVNMVADDGEIRYLLLRVVKSASLNPKESQLQAQTEEKVLTNLSLWIRFQQ